MGRQRRLALPMKGETGPNSVHLTKLPHVKLLKQTERKLFRWCDKTIRSGLAFDALDKSVC